MPDLSLVAANSERWINVNATPKGFNKLHPSNIIANAGGKWGNAPRGFADRHYPVKVNHADFRAMMQYKGAGVTAERELVNSNRN